MPYKSTDKEYLSNYQLAVTKAQEKMLKKELKEAQKIAELWTSEGAPSDIKLK